MTSFFSNQNFPEILRFRFGLFLRPRSYFFLSNHCFIIPSRFCVQQSKNIEFLVCLLTKRNIEFDNSISSCSLSSVFHFTSSNCCNSSSKIISDSWTHGIYPVHRIQQPIRMESWLIVQIENQLWAFMKLQVDKAKLLHEMYNYLQNKIDIWKYYST